MVSDHDAALDAEQIEDGQVLAGLGHHAFVGGDDQQGQVDAADAGQHVLDEALVAGHVDDADLAGRRAACSQAKPRSMVMPRSFSSWRRSGSMPVRALTRVDLPWSTWPAVPMTNKPHPLPPLRQRRGGFGRHAYSDYIGGVKTQLIRETVRGFGLTLETQAGVFAHRGLDPGTRLLIETMRVSPTARVLDLGCGYGPVGIVAAKLAERGHAVLVDPDVRATRLAESNLKLNGVSNAEVLLGDGTHDLPRGARFDVVASNPPTHSGREVLDDLVAGAYAVLKPRGRLYMVVNRLLSLRKEVEKVFGNVEIAGRSKGYIVVEAVKQPKGHEQPAPG